MSASLVGRVFLANAGPLATKPALRPAFISVRLRLAHSASALPSTHSHPSSASTPHAGSSPKVSTAARASEGPHPADLGLAWRHSRPNEDWVAKHAVYTPEEVEQVKVVHHPTETTSDKVARGMVKTARWTFDFVTGYKHASQEAAREAAVKAGKGDLSVEELIEQGFVMSKDQWLSRVLFLESFAAVPGSVAAVCRHLQSLRVMRRDQGWIHTLLQEAENERMHLLTFIKLAQPGILFRLMVLATQGVTFNAFFLVYLFKPSAAHRFVGYLEEEAVYTYTGLIDEIRRGNVPERAPGKQEVPNIAKDYWRLGDDASMLDLILAVRADEAQQRFVNHSLANLKQDDLNPFAMKHASVEVEGGTDGFTREQSRKWIEQVNKELRSGETGKQKKDAEK